jgi:hypothetical protein
MGSLLSSVYDHIFIKEIFRRIRQVLSLLKDGAYECILGLVIALWQQLRGDDTAL